MTSAAPEHRYVARRSGPEHLLALPPPSPPAQLHVQRRHQPPPPETMTTTTPTTTKKTKAKPRSKAERAGILAQLAVNGGKLTAGEAASANGVSRQAIYAWQAEAKKRGKRSAKKKRSAAAAPATNGATNGHAAAPPADDLGKATIELRGLREWVNQAVAAELRRRFG